MHLLLVLSVLSVYLGETAILLELEGLGIVMRLEMVNVFNGLPLLLAHRITIGDSHIT